jgi:hypothetical protein
MISGFSSDVRRPYRYYHQVSLVLCSAIDMKYNSKAGEWTRETVVLSLKVAVLSVKNSEVPDATEAACSLIRDRPFFSMHGG